MEFALLPHSPSIISLGRLCMLSGFSLHWPNAKAPYLIDPSGQRIDLVVDNYVPYISNAQSPDTAVDFSSSAVSTSSPLVPIPCVAGGTPEPAIAADNAAGSDFPSNSGNTTPVRRKIRRWVPHPLHRLLLNIKSGGFMATRSRIVIRSIVMRRCFRTPICHLGRKNFDCKLTAWRI